MSFPSASFLASAVERPTDGEGRLFGSRGGIVTPANRPALLSQLGTTEAERVVCDVLKVIFSQWQQQQQKETKKKENALLSFTREQSEARDAAVIPANYESQLQLVDYVSPGHNHTPLR